MCTSIVEIAKAEGAARNRDGWFKLTHSVVAYDHPQRALDEDAVLLDFTNRDMDSGARAAVELSLDSAKALYAALGKVIAEADAEEGMRVEYAGPAHPRFRKQALAAE